MMLRKLFFTIIISGLALSANAEDLKLWFESKPTNASSHRFSSGETLHFQSAITGSDIKSGALGYDCIDAEQDKKYRVQESVFVLELDSKACTGLLLRSFSSGGSKRTLNEVAVSDALAGPFSVPDGLLIEGEIAGNTSCYDIEVKGLEVGAKKFIRLTFSGKVNLLQINLQLGEVVPPGPEARILRFSIDGTDGTLVGDSAIRVELSQLSSDHRYTPTLEISAGAQVEPASGTEQDFSSPVVYTVSQGTLSQSYKVEVALYVAPPAEYRIMAGVSGVGAVELRPAQASYPVGSEVTIKATALDGWSRFAGWSGDAEGTDTLVRVSVDGDLHLTAHFESESTELSDWDLNALVGFGSAVVPAGTYADGFCGPTSGGLGGDTLYYSPETFKDFTDLLYGRIGYKTVGDKPLVVVLAPGLYDGQGYNSKVYANNMLTIQEQGHLSIIGQNAPTQDVQFSFGINVKRSWNVVVRNIYFWGYKDDAVNIGEPETHHVWIDHCTAGPREMSSTPAGKDDVDGTFEVKDGASYITISWCKTQHHWKSCLVGHSDNNGATDRGKLKVTHYANYYAGTYSRHPRVRFGQVHVLNCMYDNAGWGLPSSYKPSSTIGTGYGAAASNESQVFMENNFFLNVQFPFFADRSVADWKAFYGSSESSTGNKACAGLKQRGNDFDDSGLSEDLSSKFKAERLNEGNRSLRFDELSPESVFDPSTSYSYRAVGADLVRLVVPILAGNGKLDFFADSLMPADPTHVEPTAMALPNTSLILYPNPAHEQIFVRGWGAASAQVRIFDLAGRCLLYLPHHDLQQAIIIRSLPQGAYLLSVQTGDALKAIHWIKR